MKYRIRIKKDDVVSYPTQDELSRLRISDDGKVEKLSVRPWYKCTPPRFKVYELDDDYDPFVLYASWRDASDTYEVEWGEEFEIGDVYEGDIIRFRYLENHWDRTDGPLPEEDFNFCYDTVIKEKLCPVKMIRGVLALSSPILLEKPADASEEEYQWNLACASVHFHASRLNKETLVDQFPNCTWDDELVRYLLVETGCGEFVEDLCSYLDACIVGNIYDNPDLLLEKHDAKET